jgi:hypothetical protein
VTVPGAGGSGQMVCPAFGAADCRVGGGSGQGEADGAADPVEAEAGVTAVGARGWLGGAAATFGLGLGFGFAGGSGAAATVSWVVSGGGG